MSTRHARLGISAELRTSIASYDRMPEAYACRFAGFDTAVYLDQIQSFRGTLRDASVLDVGCGSGRDAQAFVDRGARVVGVDLSTAMVRLSERAAPGAAVVQANALALPMTEGSFDVVWAMASLVHLTLTETSLALVEMRRVIRLDGLLFLSVPWGERTEWRDDGGGGNRWFRYYRSSDEVSTLLETAGFVVIRIDDSPGIVTGRWFNALVRPTPSLGGLGWIS